MNPKFIDLIIRLGQLWRRVVTFFTSKDQVLEVMFWLFLLHFSSMAIIVTLTLNFPHYIFHNGLEYHLFSLTNIYYYLVNFSLHDFLEWFYVSPIEVIYLAIIWALWITFWVVAFLLNIFLSIYISLGGTYKELIVYMFVRFRYIFFEKMF